MNTEITQADAGPERILILFPGALGDLLCCWAALDALRDNGLATLTLVAREAWLEALPDDAVRPLSIDRREVADLFASGPLTDATRALFAGHARVESFTGHGEPAFARRLADASGGRVAVHAFRAMHDGEHAAAYFGRCLGVAPLLRPLAVRPAAAAWAEAFWHAHGLGARTLVVHAGSGSTRKSWQGSAAVAEAWRADGGAVLSLVGPAEMAREPEVPADAVVRGERLDRIAALLVRAERYVGNDSGISHLAGLVGARGVAVFGPSDPRTWHPLGDGIRVLHSPQACRRCGPDRFCAHRLPVGAVLEALRTG
jgi:ADP-heptose:LPS heptosyltransferase